MDTLQWRRESAKTYGALTLDTLVGPSSRALSTCANSLYRSFDALLHVAKGLLELDPTASYYSFHSGRGVDLVVSLVDGQARAISSSA